MGSNSQEILWEVININMGYNCLSSFKYFYKEESVRAQCDVVFNIFKEVFGENVTHQLLQPVLDKLDKEEHQP